MERPTKIVVIKNENNYEIICIDEMTGSTNSMNIPLNAYNVLKSHFETGVAEISSDEMKEYICTDCGHVNIKRNNLQITVGICNDCGHPLWN